MTKSKFSDAVHQKFTEASGLTRSGRFDEAEDILKELLHEEPEYASGWFLLGTLPTFRRNMGKAGPDDNLASQVQSFRKAVEFEPDNATFQECLGIHLIQIGEFHHSRQALEKAYQLEPAIIENSISKLEGVVRQVPNPRLLYGLAYLYNLVGKNDFAEEFRQKAFENNIHADLFMAKQHDEAERISRTILDSDSENSGAWVILGSVQCSKEQWTDAEVSYKSALEIEPEYPHAWLGLATALIHQEKFEEAQEAERKAKMFENN